MSSIIANTIKDIVDEIFRDYSEEVNSLLNSVVENVVGSITLAEMLQLLGEIQATCSTNGESLKQNNV